MIHRYIKRPVTISAIEFVRSDWAEIQEFTNGMATTMLIPRSIDGVATCQIRTLEGYITATEGDYIIKGVEGEFYPCKPKIFNKTYEYVSPGEL